ncbi:CBO0543 family protein [Anaerobacillus sp. 1_MG-2023]|uniref:CBO0543 family protein n=1 Tax=Anaerobacillus sp. 1_MG-2023 TaxID=3062655 RepID=UPI0026E26EFA|nr:CBO0543 family protein [Anaerobacillus sp. 1_MG-2023]MDO6654617.1 CBO0543 family protein [Anaerobacillus sp. 1_MG-2023]
MDRQQQFDQIVLLRRELEEKANHYWQSYSDYTTWQFWLILAFIFVPLIILYFRIDRRNIFLLGFFGYSVHVIAAYVDALGVRKSWWDYPYIAIPQLPASISIDGALVPVYFILLYQWCLSHKKNYWLYGTLSAVGFTFIFKPILIWLDLFELYTNWYVLLAAYLFVIYVAKVITDIFIKMSKQSRET